MFQLEPKGSDIRETLNLTPFYLKRLKGAHPGVPTGLTCLTYLPTPWALPDVRQVTYVRAILRTGPTCLTYPPSARARPGSSSRAQADGQGGAAHFRGQRSAKP